MELSLARGAVDGPTELDLAMRRAAERLKYERLIEAQADYLEDAAHRWRQANRLRHFLQAARTCGLPETDALQAWFAWAHARCEDLDPLSAANRGDLQSYAAALCAPPDLGPPDPEEPLWRDMGWLEPLLDER